MVDDILVMGPNEENHLAALEEVHKQLQTAVLWSNENLVFMASVKDGNSGQRVRTNVYAEPNGMGQQNKE